MVPKYLKGCCLEMGEIIRVASDATTGSQRKADLWKNVLMVDSLMGRSGKGSDPYHPVPGAPKETGAQQKEA